MILEATAPAISKPVKLENGQKRKSSHLPATLEEFLEWEQPEDGYKYEWNDGVIEKSTKMIIPSTLYLWDNLSSLLEKVKPSAGGRIAMEVINRTTPTQIRVPDLAYYTAEQIRQTAKKKDAKPITAFAIEIISDHDKINKVMRKLGEYFKAGIQVVWLIFPEFEQVYVYRSPKNVMVCQDKDLCSAEPVIPGFVISAEDLFKNE
ncbi:MAG: Uma2 family endonuclease [Bacteroidota bacterium]